MYSSAKNNRYKGYKMQAGKHACGYNKVCEENINIRHSSTARKKTLGLPIVNAWHQLVYLFEFLA